MQGGAIKWNMYEPFIDSDKNVFAGNTAIYGDDIASMASSFIRITEE